MPTPTTEKQLRNLGLNLYEVKIWAALLSRGVSTAGELSDIANVPRSRSYDVLESLEKKGFVIMKPGKPAQYTSIPPNEAIEKTKKRAREETRLEISNLNNPQGKKILSNLKKLHAQGLKHVDSPDLSGSLKGRTNIYNHMENMFKRANTQIIIAAAQKELENIADHFNVLFEQLHRKNIKIKLLTQPGAKAGENMARLAGMAETTNIGSNARFCIVDGREIIFMVGDGNEVHPAYDFGVWVTTPLAKDMEEVCLRKVNS
ncbi:TrmB family transcriptional regulator [Candidatus Woesearchaeota archaeon]|nr:TrmB family transcriptional regulator [Candidatus Woesearchaeota archaeon]